ncbi:hypothetical protein [Halorubellus litoreus]|uniref:Uncharacterized protein n=1 Tax=Halorubellus litoreus TaxID=755308 RepID=A0ABD5VG13_9EURY
MDRYDALGGALALAAVANLVLAAATIADPTGSFLVAVSVGSGAVMLAVVAVQVASGHEHTDWASSPFGEHGPEIVAVVVGACGLALLAGGLAHLL